jgi:DNA polymerase III subunit alpha
MATGFVHLRVHTEYSLVDSIVRVEPPKRKGRVGGNSRTLTEQASELGLPALAVTDLGNLFAMVKFYKAAEEAGIKPIIGADVWIEERSSGEAPERLTLLVQNQTGYHNLTQLISRSYTQGQSRGRPLVKRAWLDELGGGLIALSGRDGEVGRALLGNRKDQAIAVANEWRTRFGDRFYLEVTRCGRADDEPHLRVAIAFASDHGLPVVASNDVRFLERSDYEAHETRVCIAQGRTLDDPRRPREYTPEQYLKSADEMRALFSDLPELLENTVEVARRCSLSLKFGAYHLPKFQVPDGTPAPAYLKLQAERGLAARLEVADPQGRRHSPDEYRARLAYELGVIEQMGFSDYFLVVADFIAWAKDHGVPVGPGRGSGAGSLVAYAIGITDLDPMPYDLLFERFLNPERVSMPDFDIDFCMIGRDRVIDYVAERYGRDRVGQIITYSTMAARAVVRDVARVLGLPYIVGDRIAKMIPGAPAFAQEAADAGKSTLEHALAEVPELKQLHDSDEETQAIIARSFALEGVTRGVGVHAGGVVIAPQPLTDYAPLFCEPGGEGLRTQFDMKDLETVGLLKFDFLGLKTLTIIRAAVDLLKARPGATPIDPLKLPLDDKATYQLYADGRTTAVFQMESGGMQRSSTDLKPDRFEDIIALISLFRPGPMALIPDYVARKHGRQKTEYLHPWMEEILKPTFGIFVYQEQVMQVAQKLAGYTLGGADLLRRAMGKKKPAEMAKQRSIFVEGAKKNDIREGTANEIFNLMETFAGYGFNKSHAAAYALVSYQTAWLKAHHPAEFMAAVLSCDLDHTDTVVMMLEECGNMGLKIVPPHVNRSDYRFTVSDAGEIVYGLGAIRGVGAAALESVLAERAKHGPYKNLEDFCRRIDLRKANKRVLEALIMAGALDGLGRNRASLLKNLPLVLQKCEKDSGDAVAGQTDMFGNSSAVAAQVRYVDEPEWSDLERLRHEKNVLGYYLSGHPIESHRTVIDQIASGRLRQLIDQQGTLPGSGEQKFARRGPQVLVGAWLTDLRRFGRRASLTLDDRTAQILVPLNEEMIMSLRTLPKPDQVLFVAGRISPDTFTGGWQIYPKEIFDLDEAQRRYADRVMFRLVDAARHGAAFMQVLGGLRSPQGCPVSVRYVNGTAQAMLDLAGDWRIKADGASLKPLQTLLGDENVKVIYKRPSLTTAPEPAYTAE